MAVSYRLAVMKHYLDKYVYILETILQLVLFLVFHITQPRILEVKCPVV